MTKQTVEVAFGKVRREPGSPRNAPRWVWRCLCAECADGGLVYGPFKTKREAEQDFEMLMLTTFDGDSAALH